MHSQRWMFTSPDGEDEYKKPSVTREHYDAAVQVKAQEMLAETEIQQKRRHFESLMWKKMTEKAIVQLKKQEEAKRIPMSSTYKDFYHKQGFIVKELGSDIDEELKKKYPLYSDMAHSIYLKNVDKIKAKEVVKKPPSMVFRRDSRFTSRLSNPMDAHSPVKSDHFAYV